MKWFDAFGCYTYYEIVRNVMWIVHIVHLVHGTHYTSTCHSLLVTSGLTFTEMSSCFWSEACLLQLGSVWQMWHCDNIHTERVGRDQYNILRPGQSDGWTGWSGSCKVDSRQWGHIRTSHHHLVILSLVWRWEMLPRTSSKWCPVSTVPPGGLAHDSWQQRGDCAASQ